MQTPTPTAVFVKPFACSLHILLKTTDSFWGKFLVWKDHHRNLSHPLLRVSAIFVSLTTESIHLPENITKKMPLHRCNHVKGYTSMLQHT